MMIMMIDVLVVNKALNQLPWPLIYILTFILSEFKIDLRSLHVNVYTHMHARMFCENTHAKTRMYSLYMARHTHACTYAPSRKHMQRPLECMSAHTGTHPNAHIHECMHTHGNTHTLIKKSHSYTFYIHTQSHMHA